MNHIWPRVIVTTLVLAAAVTLLLTDCVAPEAGVGIIMAVVGFWFGQYAPQPIEKQLRDG